MARLPLFEKPEDFEAFERVLAETFEREWLPIFAYTVLGINHTYYFGNELLVAPIIEPNKTARKVYLPEGRWIDYWTTEC